MKISSIFAILFLIIKIKHIQSYGETNFLTFNNSNQIYYPTWQERELMVIINSLRMNVQEYINKFMTPFGYSNTSDLFDQLPKYQRPFLISETTNKLSKINLLNMVIENCENSNNNGCKSFEEFNIKFNNYFNQLNLKELYQNYSCFNSGQLGIQLYNNINQSSTISKLKLMTAINSINMNIINSLVCESSTTECLYQLNNNNYFRQFISTPLTLYSGLSTINYQSGYLFDIFSSTNHCENDGIDRDLLSIASGSHLFINGSGSGNGNDEITFMVNYYSYTHIEPKSIQVIIIDQVNNKKSTFDLDLLYYGLSNYSGVYSISTNNYKACNSYYFIATISKSNSVRYPTNGYLLIDDYNTTCIFLNNSYKIFINKFLIIITIIIIIIFVNFK